jgi:hypothetical protein
MSGFPAVDVAIGLIFVYVLFSVACSALSELFASLLNLRGRQLRKSLESILTQVIAKDTTGKQGGAQDGDAASTLAGQVLRHPFIQSLKTKSVFGGLKSPSYIPSRAFSLALLDCIASRGSGQQGEKSWPESAKEQAKDIMERLKEGLKDYPDLGVGRILTVFAADVGNDVEKLQERIETWFDHTMARVSGVYKRWSQLIVLIVALFVVVGANADTLRIAKTLSADHALRQALSLQAQAFVQQEVTQTKSTIAQPKPGSPGAVASPPKPAENPKRDSGSSDQNQGETQAGSQQDPKAAYEKLDKSLKQLQDLQVLGVPLGWKERPKGWTISEWLNKCVGLFLTILAVSLGAPFWFDLLGKIVNIKGAGSLSAKPAGGQSASSAGGQGESTS